MIANIVNTDTTEAGEAHRFALYVLAPSKPPGEATHV